MTNTEIAKSKAPKWAITSVVVNLLMVLAVAGLVGEVRKPDPPPVVAYQETWVNVQGGQLTVGSDGSIDWQPLPDQQVVMRNLDGEAVFTCLIKQHRYVAAWRPGREAMAVIVARRADVGACGGKVSPTPAL